jgi:hypothetical protein
MNSRMSSHLHRLQFINRMAVVPPAIETTDQLLYGNMTSPVGLRRSRIDKMNLVSSSKSLIQMPRVVSVHCDIPIGTSLRSRYGGEYGQVFS